MGREWQAAFLARILSLLIDADRRIQGSCVDGGVFGCLRKVSSKKIPKTIAVQFLASEPTTTGPSLVVFHDAFSRRSGLVLQRVGWLKSI